MISRIVAGGIGVLVIVSAANAATEKPKPESTPKKEAPAVSNDPQLTTATFGDWLERCQRVTTGAETHRLCEVVLTVVANGQSAPLAEIAVGRLKKGDPLRLTLVLPVNVSFPSAPKITADGADALDLAWRQCVSAGCFADAALSADTLQSWRAAKSAKVESQSASTQKFNFAISLRGLPQALDAMAKEP